MTLSAIVTLQRLAGYDGSETTIAIGAFHRRFSPFGHLLDKDCDEFIGRLGELVNETQTLCYAWTLIPNHFHLPRKAGVLIKSDERILGSSDFVNDVLAGAQEALDKKYSLTALGVKFTHIVEAVSELISVSPQDLIGPRKERAIVKARILVCYWAVTELGMSRTEIGKQLGISVSTVSAAVKKGQKIVGR